MSDDLKQEGLAFFQRGLYPEALAKFEAAAAGYAAAGDRANQGEVLNNAGVVYRFQRRWNQAEKTFEQARQLLGELGDRHREAQVLGNMGDLYAAQRQYEQAGKHYSAAVDLFAQTGDHDKQAQTLRVLSLMHLRQWRWIEALFLMHRSLSVKPRPSFFEKLFRGMLGLLLKLLSGRTTNR